MKSLTLSQIDRQNVLNNPNAVKNIQEILGVSGMLYDGEYRFTTFQIAEFYKVNIRTIKRYTEQHTNELIHNGYCLLKGQKLKEFKELFGYLIYNDIEEDSQRDINVPSEKQLTNKQKLTRIKALSIFNFKSFLNIGMLLSDSEKAKEIRQIILDIVINEFNDKLGGNTKYINQRDEEFLITILREPKYRKEFTVSLNKYLDMNNAKYGLYTDKIYQAIFKENALEYKKLLKLEEIDNPRDTMYSEILKLISSFEIGIADELKEKSLILNRKLTPNELDKIITNFSNKRHWIPQLEDARNKMASRDYGFRNIFHQSLATNIQSLSKDDFQRFLGEESKEFIDRITGNKDLLDVLKRLKDK